MSTLAGLDEGALRRFGVFLSARSRRVLDQVDGVSVIPGGSVRPSAVLVCLDHRPGAAPDLLFVVRSRSLRHHPGQIGFPGGRVDPGDGGAVYTALREAREEVGILPGQVELLGLLDDQFTSASHHTVTPVVVRLLPGAEPRITSDENQSLFRIDLATLEAGCRPVSRRAPGEPWCREGQWVFPTPEGLLWGLSARITHHLLTQLGLFAATGPG